MIRRKGSESCIRFFSACSFYICMLLDGACAYINTYLLQDIDKEISELKLSVNTRGRLVATEFLKQFI
jgi:hypothetical protein